MTSSAGRPRLGARVFATSGDSDPLEPRLNTFDPLFPGIAYSGRAGLIGPSNLITLDPSISFSPHRQVRVRTDWAMFWRTTTRDGMYGINVALMRPAHGSTERFVGSQGSVELDARLTTHVSVSGSVVFFNAGPFLRKTPPGLDTRYVAAHASYRFCAIYVRARVLSHEQESTMIDQLPVEPAVLLAYALAAIALVIAPGPGQALVLTRTIESGTRGGLLTSLGLEIGTLVHTLAAALGLSAILRNFSCWV